MKTNQLKIEFESDLTYAATGSDDAIIARALAILDKRIRVVGDAMSSPQAVRDYLRLRLSGLEYEVFCIMFLDNQHRVIGFEEMFRGTLNQASVYPREVVKAALAHNAAAVLLAHNHPSGVAEPSRADQSLTDALKGALALVDVRVLDHFIVAGTDVLSFAERGLI
ncbi:RadC family protein [Ferrovum myxofaciens]|uniref:RadC family protein n=1 Tax=Ferrovum myxofaciens TaxID=416213 RepID=UPI0005553A45|nr:DNA repair protein RadC [Ferrovum myxofaciens]